MDCRHAGSAEAAVKLVETIGGHVKAFCFLMELKFLNGREKLGDTRIDALIELD